MVRQDCKLKNLSLQQVADKIDDITEDISKEELQKFLNDNEDNPGTVFGELYNVLPNAPRKHYIKALAIKAKEYGLIETTATDTTDINDEADEELDKEIAKVQNAKNQTVNKLIRKSLIGESFFEKTSVLEELYEQLDIDIPSIDELNESQLDESTLSLNTNEYYEQVQEALAVIRPVDNPVINEYQHKETIIDELKENLDTMLFDKVQNFIRTKTALETKTLKLQEVNSNVQTEIDSFKNSQMGAQLYQLKRPKTELDYSPKDRNIFVFQMNKLQKKVKTYFEGLNQEIVEELEDEIQQAQDQIKMVIDNLKKRNKNVPEYEIFTKETQGILGDWMCLEQITKKLEPTILKIEAQIEKQTKKTIYHLGFFEGTKEKIKSQVVDALVLKEHEEGYAFNLLHEAFAGNSNNIEKQIEEEVTDGLTRKYNTSNANNSKSRKTFTLDESTEAFFEPQTKETVDLITSNGQVRVHLQEQIKKGQQDITYSIELRPLDFNEGKLTKDIITIRENINEEFERRQTKNAFEIYLLDGNSYELQDGTVLWYSASKKKWMREMDEISFNELYDIYSKANKENNIKGKN